MAEMIPHWLSKQADLAPEQPAIETPDGRTWTFKELKKESQQFARKLAGHGVKQGDHIGILSENQPAMVTTIHALSYLGATVVLLNTRLTAAEWRYQLEDADVTCLLTSSHWRGAAVEGELPCHVLSFSEVEQTTEQPIALREELDLDEPFTILYTSGTTGFPKGVVHTYGNHWWSAISSALNLGLHAEDKWLCALPVFHISGLSIFIKSVLYGMPVFLLEKFDEDMAHDAIFTRGVTMASVVTVTLKRLVDRPGAGEFPESFRCMLLGGGPAPRPLLEQTKERNIPVFQSYGMTETSSQIVTLSPKDALRKIGSAGKPLMPAQLKIVDQDEQQVGEIFVKGPMVTKGYYKNQHATEKSLQTGWLATGDLGRLDEEGFLYVVDRRKDLIISGGENIYPSEIESVLSGMPQVKDVGVAGVKDDTWGKVPAAFVVRREAVSAEEILAFAESGLAKYKWPKYIQFVEELPRNASNKLVRAELPELLER
ncbi:o-succinylbenzoate--CoA ligase [Lentibacillus sediminis]|uniref:o-succinylbenzoate--CoA ligase n=1 Tax=Lentibacillus sediminis TaxID=1940529 RepID=UPI000C1BB7AB|nr:o-succinylbenzoate--CoA ligase [Lentibacillus sediminis]